MKPPAGERATFASLQPFGRWQELVRMLSNRRCCSWIVCGLLGSLLSAAAGCRSTGGWVYNNSGKGYYQRGQFAMAREEFCRATTFDPNNPDYRHNLALAMKRTGDIQGAENVLRQNLTQVSAMHQPTYHSLAQILVETNRAPEAQELLAGWADTQPYVPEANVELAWIQRQTGNSAGAEQSLRHALQVDPRHPTALAHLGQLYQDNGQSDRAAAMYQRSLASRWGQPEVQSRLQTVSYAPPRPQGVSRSAMMMNMPYGPQPMYSAAPAPMMSSAPPTWTAVGQPMPMSTSPIMAAAPVLGPTPDPIVSAIPSPIPGPVVMDPNAGITFETPILAAGPVLTPNADPAHSQPAMTAELPLVDPR